MANISTSSTQVPVGHSEIDFNVELGLFPVMVPSMFLPKVGERLQNPPGDLEVIKNTRGKEGESREDDSEERVYRVLENYDRDEYMVVFHGTEINAEQIKDIWKEDKCSSWYDFIRKIDKDLVRYHPRISVEDVALYLDVPLIKDPNETQAGAEGFGFTVYTHERFVAVMLEVNSLTDVEECSAQLLESAAMVKSVMGGDNRVLAMIFCCPKLKQEELSSGIKSRMISKAIHLVCEERFDYNLVKHLNRLQIKGLSTSCESKPLIIPYKGIFTRPYSKEMVHKVLENNDRNQYKYFYVTKKEPECMFDVYQKIDEKLLKNEYVGDVTSLDVHLRMEPELMVPGTKEFDFIVIHERFVAVLEVKGLKNIEDGCTQLQQSATLVKSEMNEGYSLRWDKYDSLLSKFDKKGDIIRCSKEDDF